MTNIDELQRRVNNAITGSTLSKEAQARLDGVFADERAGNGFDSASQRVESPESMRRAKDHLARDPNDPSQLRDQPHREPNQITDPQRRPDVSRDEDIRNRR